MADNKVAIIIVSIPKQLLAFFLDSGVPWLIGRSFINGVEHNRMASWAVEILHKIVQNKKKGIKKFGFLPHDLMPSCTLTTPSVKLWIQPFIALLASFPAS